MFENEDLGDLGDLGDLVNRKLELEGMMSLKNIDSLLKRHDDIVRLLRFNY